MVFLNSVRCMYLHVDIHVVVYHLVSGLYYIPASSPHYDTHPDVYPTHPADTLTPVYIYLHNSSDLLHHNFT